MNPVKILKTDTDHQQALARLHELLDLNPAEGSLQADELELLAMLIEQYEQVHFPIASPTPLEAIRFRMEQQGLTAKDLVPFIGSKPRVSEVLNGKRPLSLNMIRNLHKGLGIPAGILIQDDSRPQPLSDDTDWLAYPLSDMRKRGYFDGFNGSIAELKEYAAEYVGAFLSSVNMAPTTDHRTMLMRTSAHQQRLGKTCDLCAQQAWQARIKHLANRRKLKNTYQPGIVTRDWMQDLAKLSSLQQGPLLAVEYLNNAGIHLVFEPHLPKTYLDGAVCLSDSQHPIIGLTLRHNRVDNFWFTLMHELAHIALHVDGNEQWFIDDLDQPTDNPQENEADALAQDVLIPAATFRHGLPATDADIRQVAASLRISPAIVAGRVRRETGNYKIHQAFFGKAFDVRDLLQAEGLFSA